MLLAFLQGMERSTPLQRVLTGIAIALFFAAALYLRIAFSHDVVFGGSIVRFTGVDAYWHVRIIDNLAHNFPHLNSLDPYLLHPGGFWTSISFPFFDYLLAGIIWVIGLGSPTQHTVDMIAPYFPPVLAALTIIPAYFIGKTMFGRWAGVIAAGLVAILPGEFLGHSILGFNDHHVAETLFSTTAVMFVLLALKNARKDEIAWSQIRHPKGTGLIKPAVYGMLGGIFLGLYLASWMGALLFVMIIAGFLLVQFCIDHLKGTPTDYLALVGAVTFLSALVVFVVFSRHRNTLAVLAIAVVMPLALFAISRLMAKARLKPFYYAVVLAGLALASFLILRYAVAPSLVKTMMVNFDMFKWNTGTTVSEMAPSLVWRSSGGDLQFSLTPLWRTYGFAMIFGIIGLCLLAYTVAKRWEPEKVLLTIWTLVILLATFGQRRFNYYLVVNIALLSGYASWEILRLAGLRELARVRTAASRDRKQLPKSKRHKQSREQQTYQLRWSHAFVALALIVILSLFTIVPYTKVDLYGTGTPRMVSAIEYAQRTADLIPETPLFEPPEAWCESLTWLRENTPEPFDDPDFYYSRYGAFDYSDYPEAYGVTAWWDYGYWIVRIGHRPPSQNPAGAISAVAEFFLAQNESDGEKILDGRGARYVILDYQFVTGKFHGAVTVTGKSQDSYFDYFVEQATDAQGNAYLQLTPYYFPQYYRSMSIRLYCFEGKAVTPAPGVCKVISWKWWESSEGAQYKMVIDKKEFDTADKASAWIAEQPSGNYEIVGESPFVSPVPLEELTGFKLRRDSVITERMSASEHIPQVRIFEYVK